MAPAPGKVSGTEEEDNLREDVCLFPLCFFVAKFDLKVKKYRTREQTEIAQARAVRFAENVLEDSDLADDLESLTPEEYSDRRGIIITNPLQGRITNMANGDGNSMTKADMQDVCDQVQDILADVYTPEASREDLAAAIDDALDLLENGLADDTDDTDGDEDDDTD
jgi:hypothetical protein